MSNKVFANMMEVSCKSASGKTICAFPDVCMTPPQTPATPPGVPIPYPNTGMASDTTDGSTTVKISDKEVMLKNKSCFSKSTGDEAGAAPKKGLVSSKNTGKVFFNMWSMDVKVEGENVVRHLDITTHNHASMPGNSPPMPHADGMAPGGAPAQAETSCSLDCPSTGNPVNPVLGAKVLTGEDDLDFVLDGPLPLRWQRVYRSDVRRTGWFGMGWTSPLEAHVELVCEPAGTRVMEVRYVDALGRTVAFMPLAPGESFFSPHEQVTLRRGAVDGHYAIEMVEGTTLRFNHADGQRQRLTKISDRNGNAVRIQYPTEPSMAPVVDVACSGGQRLALRFAGSSLVRIDMAGVDDVAPWRMLARYDFDERGDLGQVRNRADECTRTFAYDGRRMMIRHTNAGGLEARYEYALVGQHWKVSYQSDNVGRHWIFRYEPNETIATDNADRVTRYQFDRQGRWTALIAPDGGVTLRGLDSMGNLRAEVDPSGRVAETVFNERGLPIEQSDPAGAKTLIEWHEVFALPVMIREPSGAVTKYAYDDRGNLVLETDPCGAETAYAVDDRGLVTGIIDANGGKTSIAYNERGQPVSYTDCSGQSTRYEYDVNDWLIGIIDAIGNSTSLVYDAAGRLRAHVQPDGSVERYSVRGDGKLLAVEDASGRKVNYSWTPDGLLSRRTDAQGFSIEYQYDALRRLRAVVNELGRAYTFEHDALDRLIAETDFNGTRTEYRYDAADNRVASVRGTNTSAPVAANFRYDLADRLIERLVGHEHARFEYDVDGRMTLAANEHAVVRFEFDACARLISEQVDAAGHLSSVRHLLDPLGNRLRTESSGGDVIESLYYGSGHAHRIAVNGTLVSDIERDGLHREVERTQGVLRSFRSYDAAGRLTLQQAHAPGGPAIDRRFAYTPAGLLDTMHDCGRLHNYAFDAIGRLVGWDNQRFQYDPAHDFVHGHTVICDGLGRLTERRSRSGDRLLLLWGDDDNLVQTWAQPTGGEARRTDYLYDALGRRTCKMSSDSLTRFTWDGDHLLSEANERRRRVFVYEPESYVPLAQVQTLADEQGPGQIAYYHCDQIGIPREMTLVDGSICWRAGIGPWGEVQECEAHADWDQPFRMQGQYCDEESGLYHTRHRYYDPQLAGFVSPDPLGLIGGINLYAYPRDPTRFIDPLGLHGFPENPGLVRRFMPCREMKQMKRKGFTFDPKDPRGGLSATTTSVKPCNPDKIKSRTGALSADCYADINTVGLNVQLKGITKGGLPDWKIKDNVTPERVVGSGKVRKKC